MANEEHVALLKQGVDAWNAWRRANPAPWPIVTDIREFSEINHATGPDLTGEDFSGADFDGADFFRAKLVGANFRGAKLRGTTFQLADLTGADFSRAKLSRANFISATLSGVNFTQADLHRAILADAILSGVNFTQADLAEVILGNANLSRVSLRGANLTRANLERADLTKANLSHASLEMANLAGANLTRADITMANLKFADLVETDFADADLTGCRIYGVSAWGLKLSKDTKQQNLVITTEDDPEITVDNIEVAQFIYLLLNNPKIRDVIDTIGEKAVLILGRFTPKRKAILDALREELRRRNYVPILFDFDKAASQDLTATVSTLAHMVRFIIADLTDPSSIPHELATVVPTTPVPVQPILLTGQKEFAMFDDLQWRYRWVLAPHCYDTPDHLLANLGQSVIGPAEAKAEELRKELKVRDLRRRPAVP